MEVAMLGKRVRQLRFIKTNPSGNTTALVLEPVAPEERSLLATELMRQESLAVEQAAFLDDHPPRPCDLAICMMGGEFCGNAVRSAAAWKVFDRMRWQPSASCGARETFSIACSGIGHNVECVVQAAGRNAFDVSAVMPLPLSVSPAEAGGRTFWRAEFPGISHFCLWEREPLSPEAREEITRDVLAAYPVPAGGAAGVLFWDGSRLDPFVYVKDTDTLVNESSCGSGTAALAACLAAEKQSSVHVDARQRGGLIYADAVWDGTGISALSIGGLVTMTAEGMAYIEM